MVKAGDGKPRSDNRRKEHRLSKRVTEEELEAFRIRAENAGFDKASDYLGAFVLGDTHLHAANRKTAIEALGELGRLGNNINQIAKAVNQGRLQLETKDIRTLDETRNLIEQLGQEIREALR